MCGLVGFIDAAGFVSDAPPLLRAMAETIRHRGPDDDGVCFDAHSRVGFGYRRLATQDLSLHGHQPMTSASERFTIAFNGEIYNFNLLREELAALGATFRGHSDTEVMLAAFEAWGVRASVDRFVGMFAFGVWDARERELVLVRDRLGVKPLYVGFTGEGSRPLDGAALATNTSLVFASELKPFKRFPRMRFDIDRGALALYTRYGYVPTPWSIYRSVKKLPAGHLLRIRDGRCVLEQYWSTKAAAERGAAQPFRGGDADAVDALEALLQDSVRIRMIADVPLGAFLSGGIDSSAVVAAMTAVAGSSVRTFTIGVRDPVYDEAPYARAVAKHLGTDHIEQYVDPDDALSVIPSLPFIWDEPFADSSQIPTLIVSRAARQHVTVILSGDGGDELFGGYYRYRWVRSLWNRLRHLPQPMRRVAASMLQALPAPAMNQTLGPLMRALPASLRMNTLGDRAHKLAGLLTSRDPWELFHRLTSIVQSPRALLLDSHEPRTPLSDPSWLADVPDLETRMMQADMVSYLVDDILVKVDRASMAASLEAREPLLDHRLVEFALSLPTSMKIRNGTTKWLLREVLHRRVPRELFDRPKQGFSIPLDRWLVGPLRPWAEELLSERRLREEGFFRPDAVRRLWDAQLRGGRMQHQLWTVLMFQAWQAAEPPAMS
ncbi:MAG: asparagine synthase (glutamine-hydrolyzing) [Phycisphaerae bacterium]|nr:asparagine synthase (glutamine-hydrolyzing) [Phycisphaerae bacterium]